MMLLTDHRFSARRFDLRGRLAQAENVQGPLRGATIEGRLTSTFQYDHLNAKMRVEQTLPPGTPWRNQTTYLVDHHNPTGYSQVLEERSTLGNLFDTAPPVVLRSDAPLHSFLWGHGLISQNGLPVVADHQGTVRLVNWSDQYHRDAFGVPTDALALNLLGQLVPHTRTWPTEYGYTGEPIDVGIGLQFNRARWLNLTTASFVSADPFDGSLAHPLTLPKYWYAAADGVNKSDPSGMVEVTQLYLLLDAISFQTATRGGLGPPPSPPGLGNNETIRFDTIGVTPSDDAKELGRAFTYAGPLTVKGVTGLGGANATVVRDAFVRALDRISIAFTLLNVFEPQVHEYFTKSSTDLGMFLNTPYRRNALRDKLATVLAHADDATGYTVVIDSKWTRFSNGVRSAERRRASAGPTGVAGG